MTERDDDILPIYRRDLRRLTEQVDQLAEDRIERNAEIAKLKAAIRRGCEEVDYCYVCDCHPSHGHAGDCPMNAE